MSSTNAVTDDASRGDTRIHGGVCSLVTLLLGVATLAVLVRNAWLSDDIFFTLRTVDNFLAGRGLTWNPAHRVQAFTHPLWFFLLSILQWFVESPFYGTIVLGLVVSSATLFAYLLCFGHKGPVALALFVAFPLSRAFVDYSTSGLENPLSHLLLVVFLAVYWRGDSSRRRLLLLCLLAGLGVFNRMDLGLLFAPPLFVAMIGAARSNVRWRSLLALTAAGFAPFIVWELFSLVYYGAIVPNTALAKLNTGIAETELAAQGILYLLHSIRIDPITLVIVVAAGVSPFLTRDRSAYPVVIAVGLYLSYVVLIGGDFMSGRFLTAPFVVGMVLLARFPVRTGSTAGLVAATVAAVGLIGERPPVFSHGAQHTDKKAAKSDWGIADEQAFWDENTSLMVAQRVRVTPRSSFRTRGEKESAGAVIVANSVGMRGFYAPHDVHFIDRFALADPLLARLPARHRTTWRIGHFDRVVPAGYVKTIKTGENHLADPAVARLHDDLELITRGSLWRSERFAAIWRVNTGHHELPEHPLEE